MEKTYLKTSLIIIISLIVLFLCFILVTIDYNKVYAENNNIWDGELPCYNPSYTYSGGNGTNITPYQISTLTDFLQFTSNNINGNDTYNNQYFELTNDIVINDCIFNFDKDSGTIVVSYSNNSNNIKYCIGTGLCGEVYHKNTPLDVGKCYNTYVLNNNIDNLNNIELDALTTPNTNLLKNWFSIGSNSSEYPFKGHFDGNGFSISGLYCCNIEQTYSGLFGNVHNAVIENLSITKSLICSKNNASLIASSATNSTIEQCMVNGYVIACNNNDNCSGISATISSSIIKNCVNNATIIGGKFCGGIVGKGCDSADLIYNCVNYGTIIARQVASGGIIGKLYNGSVYNCISFANVSGTSQKSRSHICYNLNNNSYSYYDEGIGIDGIDTNAYGKTKSWLIDIDNYIDSSGNTVSENWNSNYVWDFNNIWIMSNNGPMLRQLGTIKYNVELYLQNIDDDKYTLNKTEINVGILGETIDLSDKIQSLNGFIHHNNTNDILTAMLTKDYTITLKIYYDRIKYNVNFVVTGDYTIIGGCLSNSIKYQGNLSAPIISKDGFMFDGWSSNGSYSIEDLSEITQNMIFVANWINDSYNINYELDDGTLDCIVNTVTYNQVVTINNPTKTGYIFTGWSSSINNGLSSCAQISNDNINFESWNGSITKYCYFKNLSNNSIILTANWLLCNNLEYKVQYYYQNINDNEFVVNHDEIFNDGVFGNTKTISPTDIYGFCFDSNNTNNILSQTMTTNVPIFRLYYTRNIFNVSFNVNDVICSQGQQYVQQTLKYEQSITNCPMVSKVGYNFVKWILQSGNGCLDCVKSDMIFVPRFTAKAFTITYKNIDSFDNIWGQNRPVCFEYDKQVVIDEPFKENYIFLGWHIKDSNETELDIVYTKTLTIPAKNYAQDLVLVAIWNIVTYTITYDLNLTDEQYFINECNIIMPNNQIQEHNQVIQMHSLSGNLFGYSFVCWSTTKDKDGILYNLDTNYVPNKDLILYAIWELKSITLTFDDSITTSSKILKYKDTISISEFPKLSQKLGYTFLYWYYQNNIEIKDDLYICFDKDITIYAKWQINTYNLIINLDGSKCSQNTVEYNSMVNIEYPTKTGYKFKQWVCDNDTYTISKNLVTIGIGDCNLNAVWIPMQYTISFIPNYDVLVETITQTIIVDENTKLLKNTYNRPEYKFLGWAISSDSNEIKYKDEEYITICQEYETLNLYAVWIKLIKQIEYDYNDDNFSNFQITSESGIPDNLSFQIDTIDNSSDDVTKYKIILSQDNNSIELNQVCLIQVTLNDTNLLENKILKISQKDNIKDLIYYIEGNQLYFYLDILTSDTCLFLSNKKATKNIIVWIVVVSVCIVVIAGTLIILNYYGIISFKRKRLKLKL